MKSAFGWHSVPELKTSSAMVLGEAGTLLAIGLAVGAAMALALAGSVSALVFGLEPHNVGIIGLAFCSLGATAIAASFLPARRAATAAPRSTA